MMWSFVEMAEAVVNFKERCQVCATVLLSLPLLSASVCVVNKGLVGRVVVCERLLLCVVASPLLHCRVVFELVG